MTTTLSALRSSLPPSLTSPPEPPYTSDYINTLSSTLSSLPSTTPTLALRTSSILLCRTSIKHILHSLFRQYLDGSSEDSEDEDESAVDVASCLPAILSILQFPVLKQERSYPIPKDLLVPTLTRLSKDLLSTLTEWDSDDEGQPLTSSLIATLIASKSEELTLQLTPILTLLPPPPTSSSISDLLTSHLVSLLLSSEFLFPLLLGYPGTGEVLGWLRREERFVESVVRCLRKRLLVKSAGTGELGGEETERLK